MLTSLLQGYELSEEEIHMPLDTFKSLYTTGDKGRPEYVSLQPTSPDVKDASSTDVTTTAARR